MSIVINQILKQALEAEQEEKSTKQQERQETVEVAKVAIIEGLGDLWPELQPHVHKEETTWASNGELGNFRYLITHPEMDPFFVAYIRDAWSNSRSSVVLCTNINTGGRYHIPVQDQERVASFLLNQRRRWEIDRRREREEEITKYSDRLTRNWYKKAETPQEADEVLAQLVELAPEREEKWQGLRDQWQQEYDADQEATAKRDAEREHLEAIADEYRDMYEKYWKEYQAVLAMNRAALDQLQAELDGIFTVWNLTYSYLAVDEEYGERYAKTRTVQVLSGEPDKDGFWPVIRPGGKVERLHYYHLVSLSEPCHEKPSDSSLAQTCYYYDDEERRIYEMCFGPYKNAGEVKDQMDIVASEAYPEPPDPPDELKPNHIKQIEREVQSGEQEPYWDPPF